MMAMAICHMPSLFRGRFYKKGPSIPDSPLPIPVQGANAFMYYLWPYLVPLFFPGAEDY